MTEYENGYKDAIQTVLGLLRSESADIECGMMEIENNERNGFNHVCATDWADWLESKLAKSVHRELTDESEIKLKDPSFRWPDDEL